MNGILLVLMIWPLMAAVQSAKVGTNGKSSGQRFALEPQDHTAIVGTRVTLPCRVIDKKGTLQWTKDDFGLGTHRNLSGFDRYSMIGSDEEGDYSLEIYPVILDDDAKYQCQVGPGPDGESGIRSRFASLTVLVPPEAPKIVQGEFMVTTEDREIELECVSVGGKPAAELTWIDGHGNVLTEGIEYVKEPVSDSRRFTAKSILKLTPKKEHHNTTFTCQAQNTADRTYRSARIKMEVKYAPKVSVSVIGGALAGGRIPEGAEVRFSCRADANPAELTYRWYLNDELQIGDYTTEMVSRMGNKQDLQQRFGAGNRRPLITLTVSSSPLLCCLVGVPGLHLDGGASCSLYTTSAGISTTRLSNAKCTMPWEKARRAKHWTSAVSSRESLSTDLSLAH